MRRGSRRACRRQHKHRTDAAARRTDSNNSVRPGSGDAMRSSQATDGAMCTWWAQPAGRRRRSLMGPQRHSTSATRRSYGGEMPPVVQAAAQPSIFPRRLAGREHVDELHREQWQHRARGARWATPRRQTRGIARAGREQGPSPSRSTASSGRLRCAAAASSGKAAAPEPSGGSSASAACPAAAQRCRSRRLTEPLRQLAPRYRRPPPILGHCRGRGERRARRCGAGSGFYSASGPYRRYMAGHKDC